MSISKNFKNHRGQFHKMNTVLATLTALYIAGGVAALSSPYWTSLIPMLAPLTAFAATLLGIGILVAVSVALIGLALYAISKNNEIFAVEALKIVICGDEGCIMLQTTDEDRKFIEENYKKVGEEHRIACATPEGKVYIIVVVIKLNTRIRKLQFYLVTLSSSTYFH